MVADVAELYVTCSEKLTRIVRKQVKASSVVIEDACQFAWYRLVRHPQRVEQEAALSWLAITAVHEAIKLARRDQRELSLEGRLDDDGELNVADVTPGPHEQLEFRERLDLVRRLPDSQQRLLWLKAIGLSYEEIASEAALTLRTVERQLHRGRNRLRAAA
jgi:RNA polymerase sigma factor (sigma-70 family)